MLRILSFVLVVIGVGLCSVEEVTIGLGDEVTIESPNYPQQASPNWEKTWKVTSPEGTKITFSCYDIRLIEESETDVVRVKGAGEIVEVRGIKYDLLLQSTGNTLEVEIKKGEMEGGGVLCYASVPIPPTTTTLPTPVSEENNWQLEAGGKSKILQSLNYPQDPPVYLTQTWHLVTESTSRIRITCHDLRTIAKENDECVGIYALIVDNGTETMLCGSKSGYTLLSSGPELRVEFRTKEYPGGYMKCEVAGKVMDWYGEATPPPPSTVPPYLNIESEEVDSSEHGGPPGNRTTTCPCGWTNKETKRIVNGQETGINEYPWMVAIVNRKATYQFCGGSLITAYHALTAAHCTVSFVNSDTPISIIVGDHNLYIDEETTHSKKIDVERIIQHPDYEIYSKGEDISLLLLAEKVEFNQFVGPVCLSPTRLSLARQYAKIIGWGRLKWGGESSDTLQKVDVRVIHLESCNKVYSSVSLEKRVHICTYSHQKASCQGDSGGPVVWLDPETNRYVLIGLVSFGTICANETPSVHADVSAYYDWIQQNIKDTIPEKTCEKA